jgi:Xaa-Pro aminopeptidase
MEKGKHTIDVDRRIVTFGHETKTIDGSIILTTSFDFSKVDLKRLLKRAADAELIAWRAKSGIKGLTTAEAEKTLQNSMIDCSAVVERVKHVKSESEKKLEEARAKMGPAAFDRLLQEFLKNATESEAQDEMEQGETTE